LFKIFKDQGVGLRIILLGAVLSGEKERRKKEKGKCKKGKDSGSHGFLV
jgi:hypothetical protein